jgi:hypothetical protein
VCSTETPRSLRTTLLHPQLRTQHSCLFLYMLLYLFNMYSLFNATHWTATSGVNAFVRWLMSVQIPYNILSSTYSLASNEMIVYNELGRMWKEAAVTEFKVLSSRNFRRGTEGYSKRPQLE